jgi:hypothetical protein
MHFVTCTAYYVSLRLYMHAGRSDLSAHNSISAAVPVPVCVVCLMCSATANTAHSHRIILNTSFCKIGMHV